MIYNEINISNKEMLNAKIFRNSMIHLFSDASAYPQHKIAIGAFISMDEVALKNINGLDNYELMAAIENDINYLSYSCGKSTWCEIKTLIEALQEILIINPLTKTISVYTDCQTIVDLIGSRRIKLEKKKFLNSKGVLLANADLYHELYTITDTLNLTVIKIKGHSPASQQINISHRIFSCIDKLARKKLKSLTFCVDSKKDA
jgi:ribonuclease HI